MELYEINEAAGIELACGVPLVEHMLGKRLLDLARKAIQADKEKPQIPCNEFIGRHEDMSRTGSLRILRQEDGDMCVSIIDEAGYMSGVEFCVPVAGGGKSPKTFAALQALAAAIIEDNLAMPSRAANA